MKKLKFWIAGFVLLGILLKSEAALACAQSAMRLWFSSVAPALFPFLALMPLLTGEEACAAYNRAFSRFMGPVFGLPGAAAPAMIIGMIAGSPGGAIAVNRVARTVNMRKGDAKRLALAVTGVSPAYLIMGVGQALFHSAKIGFILAAIQLLIQLSLLFVLRGARFSNDAETLQYDPELREDGAMRSAVLTVMTVCGYMVIFGVIAGVVASFAGKGVGTAALLLADLPSGLAELAECDFSSKMLVVGAALGFGGLCIGAQNLDHMRDLGVDWRSYFSVRGVAAALFACVSGTLLRTNLLQPQAIFGKSGLVYAFSLLIACLFAVPGLIFLSKNLFLNNSSDAGKAQEPAKNSHI